MNSTAFIRVVVDTYIKTVVKLSINIMSYNKYQMNKFVKTIDMTFRTC